MCKVLLARGATPDLGVNEMTPLRAAVEVGNSDMTSWLLQQSGTWSGEWDNDFFALLLKKTPASAKDYLDTFASVLNHSKRGLMAIKYSGLRAIYGNPSVPVLKTALALATRSPYAREILSHRVMMYMLRAKWKGFARRMFRQEFTVYCALLVSYYVPTVWADPDWVHLVSHNDYMVACARATSWACSAYLLIRVERNEFLGTSAKSYFTSFWNWLNLITYVATMATIPLEFMTSLASARNSILALITVTLWVNMLQFLQMSTDSGLLIAMMSHMVKDVYRFMLLYGVFLFGFSGAFYLLLRGTTGYENFTNSFITVLLMLFGQITYDNFNNAKGWIWHMSNFLLFVHLMSIVIVLLNILIAMMATTYSDVWEAAEAEALQSHAQAILRMESSLHRDEREAIFNRLLVVERVHKSPSLLARATSARAKIAVMTTDTNSEILQRRSTMKRNMLAGITEKVKGLPLGAQAKHALQRTLQFTQHAQSPPPGTTPAQSSDLIAPLNDSASAAPKSPGKNAAATIMDALLQETPNFTALEESLFLKSALDNDEDEATVGSRLGILEDGIRYEVPAKKSVQLSSEEADDDAIEQLRAQVQQLTQTVLGLQNIIQDNRVSTVDDI